MKIERKGDWLSAQVGDELVMMSAERGNYIGLTEVGARIWELIAQPVELDDLCARLEQEFDVSPEACRAEVRAFLDELAAQQAAALNPA
jgi:Coenzyme PQQ synthesis protein D (PqqD)